MYVHRTLESAKFELEIILLEIEIMLRVTVTLLTQQQMMTF
jgi:hypothetical protein